MCPQCGSSYVLDVSNARREKRKTDFCKHCAIIASNKSRHQKPEAKRWRKMKCAVYRYMGDYGDGLTFVPVEHESDWVALVKWYGVKWNKLGNMEIDPSVIKFQKEGNHPNENSPLHNKEIIFAEYYYAE